jgi:hypothetical protein
MARGFESKDVEYQQAEAARRPAQGPALTAEQRKAEERRLTLELALARARSDLGAATSPAHQQMLEQAIAELVRQLAAPQSPQSPGPSPAV